MQIILTGATGLIGSGVLHHILALTPTAASTKQISRVSILSRRPDVPLLAHPLRPTNNTHTKVEVIAHADFNDYPPSLLSTLKAASDASSTTATTETPVAVIWALGMSQNDAKSAEQYTEVTKTYSISAAKAFATAFAPRPVNFVYVSGEGATHNPGRFTPIFGRVKGETETELLALTKMPEFANLRVYNVRPAGVDPGAKLGGQPAVNELWEERSRATAGVAIRLAKAAFMPVLRSGAGASFHTPTVELSKVLIALGMGDGKPLSGAGVEDGGWTLRNVGLRRMAVEME